MSARTITKKTTPTRPGAPVSKTATSDRDPFWGPVRRYLRKYGDLPYGKGARRQLDSLLWDWHLWRTPPPRSDRAIRMFLSELGEVLREVKP